MTKGAATMIREQVGTALGRGTRGRPRASWRGAAALALVTLLAAGGPGPRPATAQGGPTAGDSGPWAPATFMLDPRSEGGIAQLDSRMYVLGGSPLGRTPSDVVQVWDAASDHWELAPPLPMALHHPMAVGFGGKLYVFGGEFEGAG